MESWKKHSLTGLNRSEKAVQDESSVHILTVLHDLRDLAAKK